jgi:hypothetical protein
MNMKIGALVSNRANVDRSRVARHPQVGAPGGTERSTLGNPMKMTMFREWEERSPWTPRTSNGFRADRFGGYGVRDVWSVADRRPDVGSGATRRQHGRSESIHHPKHMMFDTLLVVCPEHVDTLPRPRTLLEGRSASRNPE